MDEILQEAFRHSAWATTALIAACRDLSPEQIRRPARGYGSILATLHHVIDSDADYAAMLGGVLPAWATAGIDTDDLDRLATRVGETARVWDRLLAKPIEAGRLVVLDDGAYECSAAVILAQALQHASAHREQVRASLADLGIQPPDVQPWAYADETGRSRWLRPKD